MLESSTIKKGGGTTESLQVLDVDKGFSFGAQAQVADSGGGFNVSRQGALS